MEDWGAENLRQIQHDAFKEDNQQSNRTVLVNNSACLALKDLPIPFESFPCFCDWFSAQVGYFWFYDKCNFFCII